MTKREGLKSFTLTSTKDARERKVFQVRSFPRLLTEQNFRFVRITNIKADFHVPYIKMLGRYSRLWYGVLEDSRDRSDWVYVGYEGFEILRRRADH